MPSAFEIAVCSFHTPNFQELAELTVPNKEAYCRRHGYNGVFDMREGWQPYDKFRLVRMLIEKHDAVLWIDCDALFMNPTSKVEALIDRIDGPKVLTITRDGQNDGVPSVNSGVFLMEHCPETIEFLDWALRDDIYADATKNPNMNKDQPILNAFVTVNRDLCRIMPQRTMNSYLRKEYPIYLYPWSEYEEGDWILHFAGLPYERRIELARRYLSV